MGDVYKFLGFAKYYLFDGDFLLSFINGFIFLESIINHIWLDHINEFSTLKDSTDNSRDWTLNMKVDVLFMVKKIDQDDQKVIHIPFSINHRTSLNR